jgi:hypothetical protein
MANSETRRFFEEFTHGNPAKSEIWNALEPVCAVLGSHWNPFASHSNAPGSHRNPFAPAPKVATDCKYACYQFKTPEFARLSIFLG